MSEAAAKKKATSPRAGRAPIGDELQGVPAKVALKLMKDMLLFRRFEEKAEEAYAIGKIGGFCHLHTGQEGSAAGTIGALRSDDYVSSTYREHTQALAKGISPRAVMAELYGRRDGCSGGRGGSMHLFDPSKGFMGGNGIVGGQVPTATGFGFAIKYRGEDRVSVCFLGEAALNQGAFHESVNLAAVWKLPCIFAVENNEYGMGTAFGRVSRTEIIERAAAYGIPAYTVNGQDVLATYQLFTTLVANVRKGGGPHYVDIQTYRFKGHSMSDPVSGTYRSKEEVDRHVTHEDPITVLKDRLFAAGALDQKGLEAMDAEARAVVQDAADFADQSPAPDPADLYQKVYSEINPNGLLFLDGREDAPGPGAPAATGEES
jgi:pyruvate dehydrogenase E1 component alpha subunit